MRTTIPQALVKLSHSKFRGRFKLNDEMREIVVNAGIEGIRQFAVERIKKSLAPENPPNDGKQTPMKGHPVFIAQHATATCCRNCLHNWWRVSKGIALTDLMQEKVVNLIMAWIQMQMDGGIEVLKSKMTQEELENIPFWSNNGKKFECPYNKNRKSGISQEKQ